jgi:hypothetical protein
MENADTDDIDSALEDIPALLAELSAARKEAEELREALWNYGGHGVCCPAPEFNCICGFTEALKSHEQRKAGA